MPATGADSGTPASIIESVPPQIVAMEEEPFDSSVSDTTRIVYGNSSPSGSTAESARSARLPWPTSRRPGPRCMRASPTENGGKL